MRKWMCIMLMAAGMAMGREELWTLRLPDTAILPSYVRAAYISRMGERHGGSHLGMQEYTVNLPFADGRKSHVGKWWYNVQGNVTTTLLDVGGGLDMRRDDLFDFSVPVTLIRQLGEGQRLMFTLMPRYSGDAVSSARAWDLTVVADYYVKHGEKLTYSIGLASSPRFAEYVVMPYITFSWQMTEDWLMRLRGYRLSALYRATPKLQIGPSLGGEGGSWMVATERGQRIFRLRALTAALTAEYDFSQPGTSKKILNVAVGATLATTAEFCNRKISRDCEEMRHYHPGYYLSLELDFRF